ncbi:hypothetical protein [Nocardia cyriacigeorgica]|uniref:hypothetical protein n=1 Tax=Nocardia cyriacigeorgica TaxID=135487 RepID=UPI0034DAF99A
MRILASTIPLIVWDGLDVLEARDASIVSRPDPSRSIPARCVPSANFETDTARSNFEGIRGIDRVKYTAKQLHSCRRHDAGDNPAILVSATSATSTTIGIGIGIRRWGQPK